jgi:hypothetical protein
LSTNKQHTLSLALWSGGCAHGAWGAMESGGAAVRGGILWAMIWVGIYAACGARGACVCAARDSCADCERAWGVGTSVVGAVLVLDTES